ncbi:DUF3311 domain-containing protein [Streptomyces sp. JNUCC 63]
MSNAPDITRAAVTPARVVIALCLVAPFVALLWVGSYARTEPTFIGVPFFYWYQMLWVVLSTVLTMVAYRLWQRDRHARTAATAPSAASGPSATTAATEDGGADR